MDAGFSTTGTVADAHTNATYVNSITIENEVREDPCNCRWEIQYERARTPGKTRLVRIYKCDYCYSRDGEYAAYLRSFWELVDTQEIPLQRMLRQVDSNHHRVLKEPLLLPAPSFGDGLPATG